MLNQNTENKKKNPWDETIRTVLVAVILALTFRSFAYEPFHIPTGSMKDTLLVGDYLFVSKYSYGYSRYSFPFGLPLFQGRVMEMNAPKRGDVVVFRLPSNPRIDYIKRIIGMPGDHIQVKQGVVFINGEELKRQPLGDVTYSDTDNATHVRPIGEFAETLPEGKTIHILKEPHGGPADDTIMYEVPPGDYFMMGDNRDHSHDSRFLEDVGYVPAENIVGHAQIIFFSTDGTAQWANPVSWFTAMRFDRFFKLIE